MTPGEFRDRLIHRAAATGVRVPGEAIDKLATYVALLKKWTMRVNLTSLPLDPLSDEALDRLLLEPIAAVNYVPDRAVTWFDLGTGGGSPALPLKILKPDASLVMVEPKARKVAFLREVVRTLELDRSVVESRRFQELGPEHDNSADLVTVRALRIDEELNAVAERLLEPGGSLLLFGSAQKSSNLRGFRQIGTVSLGNSGVLTINRRVPRGT